ncbi:hypothetical protein AB3S75_022286 [Citrus x aurantiifolia]
MRFLAKGIGYCSMHPAFSKDCCSLLAAPRLPRRSPNSTWALLSLSKKWQRLTLKREMERVAGLQLGDEERQMERSTRVEFGDLRRSRGAMSSNL